MRDIVGEGAFHVTSGGLTSYGPDVTDNYQLAAGYVDRILRGEKPPTCRYKPRRNTGSRSTSRPQKRSVSTCRMLLALADEVIEKSSGSGCAFSLTSTETLSRGGKR